MEGRLESGNKKKNYCGKYQASYARKAGWYWVVYL